MSSVHFTDTHETYNNEIIMIYDTCQFIDRMTIAQTFDRKTIAHKRQLFAKLKIKLLKY